MINLKHKVNNLEIARKQKINRLYLVIDLVTNNKNKIKTVPLEMQIISHYYNNLIMLIRLINKLRRNLLRQLTNKSLL